jgi:Ran GTPase-activating protein (RanGAP) involved in mRNA processing and transport
MQTAQYQKTSFNMASSAAGTPDGIDWNAVEMVVGSSAAGKMKQGEGITGYLDLSSKSITDEGCRTIAPALRTMPNLKTLDFRNNNIGDNGIASICRVVPDMVSLDYLDLSGNKMGNVGCQCLLELVENDSVQSLIYLELRENPNISWKRSRRSPEEPEEEPEEELKDKFKRVWREKGKNTMALYLD